jgi:hypothetical protein
MDVCTIFLHNFSKKIWLQFICNKLISTTAHESVKIISTKWFIHISHLISVSIFLENFDAFLFVWSFSVMRFLRLLLKHLMSVRPSKISAIRNSPDCNHKLIDVKLYNVLEIHCSCPQWFLDFFIEGRVEGVGAGFCNPQLLNNHSMDWSKT